MFIGNKMHSTAWCAWWWFLFSERRLFCAKVEFRLPAIAGSFFFFNFYYSTMELGNFEVLHTLVSSRKIRQQQERKRKWSKLSNWKFVKRTARVSEDCPGAVPLGHGEITFPLIVGRVYVLFLQLHQRFFRLKCHRSHPPVSLNWRSSI